MNNKNYILNGKMACPPLRRALWRACGTILLAAVFAFFSPSSMGSASTPLANAHAFPVPFLPSRGDKNITFTDLSSAASIRIYSMSGDLVQILRESDGDGLYVWDGKSSDGNNLMGGVYLYLIESSEDEKSGKLVIVR